MALYITYMFFRFALGSFVLFGLCMASGEVGKKEEWRDIAAIPLNVGIIFGLIGGVILSIHVLTIVFGSLYV